MTVRNSSEMMMAEVREITSAEQTCLERAVRDSNAGFSKKFTVWKNLAPQKAQHRYLSENGVVHRLSIFLEKSNSYVYLKLTSPFT